MRTLLRGSLVALCLLASLAVAGPKKKGKKPPAPVKPPPTAEVDIKLALDARQEQVGACVLDSAGNELTSQLVRVSLTLNSAGQLLGADVGLEPEPAQAAKLRECVTAAVRGASFPRLKAPLVKVEREWTFRFE